MISNLIQALTVRHNSFEMESICTAYDTYLYLLITDAMRDFQGHTGLNPQYLQAYMKHELR